LTCWLRLRLGLGLELVLVLGVTKKMGKVECAHVFNVLHVGVAVFALWWGLFYLDVHMFSM
jgi:hypothetical protein